MKTYMVILGVLLSVLADTAQAETYAPQQAAYSTGLEQLERGESSAASESFYQAIALAPTPQATPVEYLPYVNLSIALFEMGHTRAARDALIQSQVFGVAANTAAGRALLDRYAAEIMSAPLDHSKLVLLPPPETTESPTSFHSDQAISQVESGDTDKENDIQQSDDSTIKRCASSISRADDKLPWFFYYQCGVELMTVGDAQMAINAFEMGANALDNPRRGKRMYGMWFIDYLPYYQMALAYSQLGNWERASAAIKSSETYGEFTPGDPDYETFSELDRLIKRNLKQNDS